MQGAKSEQLQEALAALDPGLAKWADEFVFGEVWGREGLSVDERRLVAITALAVGGHEAQLRNYLHGALQDGYPPEKLREALVMTVVYAGFPRAIASMVVFKSVLESHQRAA
jgi:alkylhydroperoxidase/carboxymuconolactone decarboxylase family protein YurZ